MIRQWLQIRELKEALEKADETIDSKNIALEKSIKRANKAENKCTDLGRERDKLKTELNKTKKLVREQTGADLLVNALTELGVVPRPEKAPDPYQEQTRLRDQMAAMQNSQPQHRHDGLANMLGGGFR